MTLATTVSRVSYPGTGSTGPFAFPFKINVETDLLVTRRSALLVETAHVWPADFTVAGVGNASGTITLTAALAVGDTIFIRRKPPLTQPMSIRNQGAYFPATIEDEADRLVMQEQSLSDSADRSLKLKESVTGAPALVELEPISGYVPTGTGSGFTMAPVSSGATSLPGGGRLTPALSSYLNNNALWNVKDFDVTATLGNGILDARAATLLAMAAAGATQSIYYPPGIYPIAVSTNFTSGVVFAPGAVLKPATGVVLTFSGLFSAPLGQIFNLQGSSYVAFGSTALIDRIYPEWWGANLTNTAAGNTTAIQNAILSSLGMPNDLAQQATGLVAPVLLTQMFVVNTIYCPRYATIFGTSPRCGLTSLSAGAILILGRSLAENTWLQITFRDFEIHGNLALTSQFAMQGGWTGAGVYAYPLDFNNIYIRDIGGGGIQILNDHVSSQLLNTSWNNVQCINCIGNAVKIKVGVFNAALFQHCSFTDNLNGFYIQDIGSGTTASEAIKFHQCLFEANGRNLAPATQTFAVGAYGFKSDMYTGHYEVDNCYFENNGNGTADATGSHMDVRSPWMLDVHGSLFNASNNLLFLRFGGQAKFEGNFISMSAVFTSVFTLDQPQPGSDLSNLHIGKNRWSTAYTQAQLIVRTNGSLTEVTGYQGPISNYYEIPPRQQFRVMRDRELPTINLGAIGCEIVRNVKDNAGGADTIAVNGKGSIIKNTVFAFGLITEWGNGVAAVFIVTPPGNIVIIGQRGALFTITPANAGTLNIINDVPTTSIVVENKLATVAHIAVHMFGGEKMLTMADLARNWETAFMVGV